MKKIFAMILTIVMLTSIIPFSSMTSYAAENPQSAPLRKGADDLSATGDYDYTDPDNPYMATNFDRLKEVFREARPT